MKDIIKTKEQVLASVPQAWEEECQCGYCNTTHSWVDYGVEEDLNVLTVTERNGNGTTYNLNIHEVWHRVGLNEWVRVR